MDPQSISDEMLSVLASIMDNDAFETYLFYYDESMDVEILTLLSKGAKQ
jgi:hypothetical protein